MWKLTIEDDEGNQTPLPLAHEEYRIGRAESNGIRLTDRNVSRSHAVLKKAAQGWVIHDLQSYNGTYANGVRVVGEQAIASGEVIQLGDYRLELMEVAAVEVPVAGHVPPQVPGASQQRPNRLVVVVGPSPGTEFPLEGEHFSVGRSEEANVSINHSSVSRFHADIFALGNGRYEIVDKGSANGIRINGVELKRGILEAGDALELGDVRLRFVAAGKIFRADISQQAALAAFDGMGSGAGRGLGIVKLVGIGAGVGLILLLGIVLVVGRVSTTTADPIGRKHVVTKENAKQLDDAIALLAQQKIGEAHRKLLEIPEPLRPTDDESFKKIEGAWAEARFHEVQQASDSKAKKAILREVMSTETVDPKQRTRAAEELRRIEASEPATPEPSAVASPQAPLSTAVAASTGEKAQVTVVTPPPAQGPPDENQARRLLESRVWAGKGSVEDIKLLRAICKHMGDHVCRDRASDMLKRKQDQQ